MPIKKVNKIFPRPCRCQGFGEAEMMCPTRMHSSRMRTGRSLTVCPEWGVSPCQGFSFRGVSLPGVSPLPGGFSLPGGPLCQGVLLPRGVCLPGGVLLARGGRGGSPCQGGLSLPWGGVSLPETPPPWTESQTRVKT